MSTALSATQTTFVRKLLNKTLKNIIKEIPDNDEWSNAIIELTSVNTSLYYKAPEILIGYITIIHNALVNMIPINEDNTKNPQWKKNIIKIWTTSCTQLDEELLNNS